MDVIVCELQVHCVEFQKRGLPHMHLVVWLEEPLQMHEYDQVICAEIPERGAIVMAPADLLLLLTSQPEGEEGSAQQRLYKNVTKSMIHKCGE